MGKNTREKEVEVELEDGKKVKILVKKPSSYLLAKAQKLGAKVWTEALKDGLFTKLTLGKFMEENGIWGKDKESEQARISSEIQRLEREIALGVNGRKLKVSEGKEKAIQLRQFRNALRELIAEKIALETNTAEGLSDNAKFNFLVAHCTFYAENGNKVYNSLNEYEENADDVIGFTAAATLGELVYNLDKNYEESLPENQFLKKFHLVNDDLSLINQEGEQIDVDGTLVNDKGWLVNENGERIDRQGNLLSDEGQMILQAEYEDDINPPKPAKPKRQSKKETNKE